jgi:hypothetical protein
VWFRRGRLLMVSPDSRDTACPLSGRNSTYRPVQIREASSDLYRFPRAFQQAYYFWEAIVADHEDDTLERINRTFAVLPWQGGYSAVSFFEHLKYAVPHRNRPRIVSIHYGSPGWFELSLFIAAALSLSRVVRSIAATIDQCNATYRGIYEGMQARKLLRISTEREALRLEKEQLDFLIASARELSSVLGLSSPKAINERTDNPYITLKILMAVYHRVRTLAEFERRGKAHFPTDANPP